jgi:hypothetical protein
MPLGKLLKTQQPDQPRAFQNCLLTRQCGPNGDPHGTQAAMPGLWTLLDPDTNNVLAAGIDTAFLLAEIEAGRLELEAGWDRS